VQSLGCLKSLKLLNVNRGRQRRILGQVLKVISGSSVFPALPIDERNDRKEDQKEQNDPEDKDLEIYLPLNAAAQLTLESFVLSVDMEDPVSLVLSGELQLPNLSHCKVLFNGPIDWQLKNAPKLEWLVLGQYCMLNLPEDLRSKSCGFLPLCGNYPPVLAVTFLDLIDPMIIHLGPRYKGGYCLRKSSVNNNRWNTDLLFYPTPIDADLSQLEPSLVDTSGSNNITDGNGSSSSSSSNSSNEYCTALSGSNFHSQRCPSCPCSISNNGNFTIGGKDGKCVILE